MPHGDIGRRRAGRAARNALLDRDALAGRAKLLLDHGHVLGEVVVHVELAACTVGIEHAHLDHGHLPESMFRSGTLSALGYLVYLTQARTISDPQSRGRCCSLARLSVPLLYEWTPVILTGGLSWSARCLSRTAAARSTGGVGRERLVTRSKTKSN